MDEQVLRDDRREPAAYAISPLRWALAELVERSKPFSRANMTGIWRQPARARQRRCVQSRRPPSQPASGRIAPLLRFEDGDLFPHHPSTSGARCRSIRPSAIFRHEPDWVAVKLGLRDAMKPLEQLPHAQVPAFPNCRTTLFWSGDGRHRHPLYRSDRPEPLPCAPVRTQRWGSRICPSGPAHRPGVAGYGIRRSAKSCGSSAGSMARRRHSTAVGADAIRRSVNRSSIRGRPAAMVTTGSMGRDPGHRSPDPSL